MLAGHEVGSGSAAVACVMTYVLARVVRVSLCRLECSCSSACNAVGLHSCFLAFPPSHPVRGRSFQQQLTNVGAGADVIFVSGYLSSV